MIKNKIYFVIKILVFIVIICLGSCNNKLSQLDLFFADAEQELTRSQKILLKGCMDIDSLKGFALSADTNFTMHFNNPPDEIMILLDSLGVFKNRSFILLMAFQKKLNHKEYSFDKLKDEYKLWDDIIKREVEEREDRHYTNLFNIAKTNFKKFSKGDTLCLEFPLSETEVLPYVFYADYYDKINFKDTLFVKCILLEKEIELKNEVNNLGHHKVDFKARVLSLSKPACFYTEETQVGDEINIDVFFYGRPIENCGAKD